MNDETYEVKFINYMTGEYWDLFRGTYSECDEFLSTQPEDDQEFLTIEVY